MPKKIKARKKPYVSVAVIPPIEERKKWQRVNWDTVASAYITRDDLPSYDYLAKEFGIHVSSMQRVAHREDWITQRKIYWEKVGIKMQEKASNKVAEMRAKNIVIANKALEYLGELLQNKSLNGSISDIDKIIRTIEYLNGNPDSRPDGGGSFEEFLKRLNAERRKAYKDSMGVNNVIDVTVSKGEDDDTGKRPDKPDNK